MYTAPGPPADKLFWYFLVYYWPVILTLQWYASVIWLTPFPHKWFRENLLALTDHGPPNTGKRSRVNIYLTHNTVNSVQECVFWTHCENMIVHCMLRVGIERETSSWHSKNRCKLVNSKVKEKKCKSVFFFNSSRTNDGQYKWACNEYVESATSVERDVQSVVGSVDRGHQSTI